MRSEVQHTLGDAEQVKARISELLLLGLAAEGVSAKTRAVVRHLMRRLGMAIPGEAAVSRTPAPPTGQQIPEPDTTRNGRQLAYRRRQRNMAEEDGIPDIDSRALCHRRIVCAKAEQYHIDNGILFPSEEQIAHRLRTVLQAELTNGKHTLHHAATIRRLIRSIGIIVPGEAYVEDDETEVEESAADDDGNGEGKAKANASSTRQDDDIPYIEGVDFEEGDFD